MTDDQSDPKPRRCGFCESPSSQITSLMKCSGCLITYYCNREHQVADWKRHKQLCKELQSKRKPAVSESESNSNNLIEKSTTPAVKRPGSGRLVENVQKSMTSSILISHSSPQLSNLLDRSINSGIEKEILGNQSPQRRVEKKFVDQPTRSIPDQIRTVFGPRSIGAPILNQSIIQPNNNNSIRIEKSIVDRSIRAIGSDSSIKRELIDLEDESEKNRRSSVIMAAPKPPPPENHKRSRDHEKTTPPGPKRARRSIASASAATSNVQENFSNPNRKFSSSTGSISIDDEYGPKKDHGLNCPLDLERDNRFRHSSLSSRYDAPSSRLAKMAQFVAASLREYGWAIVDKFLGERHCRAVLQELQFLHERGDFTEGRLLNSKRGGQLHGIRSDMILFLTNGSDEGIQVGLLVAIIDSLIFHLSGSVPPYNISGRTRPMLTCYPGQRSRYITHVDNPDKDGRCVTATYYLNEDWRPAHGGLLRLYPTSAFKPVDIEPIFDRLVLYWSDRRNPHEILPSYRKRFSINTWYFDNSEKAAADARQLQCDSPAPKSCV